MGSTKVMGLYNVPWTEEVENNLARIQGDDCLSWYRQEVLEKRANVLGVFREGQQIASLVVRRDVTEQGDELVIVACGGQSPDNDLMDRMLPLIERVAAAEWGFATIRFHTIRLGLGKKAVTHGYSLVEWVYRKDVTGHAKVVA